MPRSVAGYIRKSKDDLLDVDLGLQDLTLLDR